MAFQPATLPSYDTFEVLVQSTFALDLLTKVATTLSPDAFNREMAYIFGEDIPERVYSALRERLLAGQIENPKIVITHGRQIADYDNCERVIRIHTAAMTHALGNQDAVELLDILLHEFGHHIDNVLRHDLYDHQDDTPSLATDSKGEEGVRFSLRMAWLGKFETSRIQIATYQYLAWDQTFDVEVDWSTAYKIIMQRHNNGSGGSEAHHPHPDREGFEAGSHDAHGHTHQTIEWVLRDFNFSRAETDAVYFGNWLRDYSQVVDPKVTRAPDMPKAFPAMASREAWTNLVDVLAAKKFIDLRQRYPAQMKVTAKRLGVYRAQEHIDNPLTSAPPFPDPKVRDPDFEPWVLQGDPLIEIDRDTSMKRYISRSVEYMQQELRETMREKRSLDGLRSFGSALHVLEDLFAHSNFAELSLIKAGHTQVLPWTTPAHCKWSLPLVTGTFGATDIIASLAAPLGKILFSTGELEFELTQPGYRSDRDKVMLILLSEHPEQIYFNAFNALLKARDQLALLAKKAGIDVLKFYRWLISTPAGILLNAYNTAAQGVLTWIGNSVDDAQTLLGNDPNTDSSIEPTHTQLSKDHAEHPLHDLSAQLATEAVRQVAQAMIDYWDGKPDADPIAVASAYFCHPMDAEWQDEIVKSWAYMNEDQLARAKSKSELDKTQQNAIDELRSIHNQLTKDSQSFLDYVFNSPDQYSSGFRQYAEKAFMAVVSKTSWWKEIQNLAK